MSLLKPEFAYGRKTGAECLQKRPGQILAAEFGDLVDIEQRKIWWANRPEHGLRKERAKNRQIAWRLFYLSEQATVAQGAAEGIFRAFFRRP